MMSAIDDLKDIMKRRALHGYAFDFTHTTATLELAALTTEENRPEGPGRYKLTIDVDVEEDDWDINRLEARAIWDRGYTFLGDVTRITGHWQKVEE